MKIIGPRSKKAIFIVIGAIVALMALVIILISPIAKYLIEKYDEKYTGRQIETGWVYVNPFTGYIHISNLKIYESRNRGGFMKDDSIFFTAKGLSVNFAMLKFLSKTIEISEITLNQPRGIVIQNKKEFNFFDLIKKFTPDKADKTPSKIHFDILNIKISAGEFYYREKSIPINYFITKVDLESAGKRWNADTIGVKFSLFPGTGSGDMNGDFTINFKTGDYRYAVLAHKFGLNIIEQYLKDLTNHGSFSANLDADMEVSGNFADQENMNGSGMLAINDFHFGKNPATDYASFDKLALTIIKINPKNHQYLFDSVSLSHPFVLYERYDYLDNVQAIFGKNGVNIANAAADPAFKANPR
ncbi:MAG: hypothetical protein NTW16_13360 [Bacteroidetes bacterium]|nr:hypothetical protein [Bacteroidota bacterium]